MARAWSRSPSDACSRVASGASKPARRNRKRVPTQFSILPHFSHCCIAMLCSLISSDLFNGGKKSTGPTHSRHFFEIDFSRGNNMNTPVSIMNETSSKLLDSIKFVEPSLLKDKLVTESTKHFIRESPLIRLTILGLVIYASKQLKTGMSLLDVGAGDCPYKSVFANITYKSTDFAGTEYHQFKEIDYVCPADNIPVKEKSFEAVLCTEVLEHVPEPKRVLAEFNRVLKNKGNLFLTTPFIYQVHEEPYDFFRYTPYSFKNLLEEAGFEVVFITSRGGWIASIASTLRDISLRPSRNVKGLLP